MRAARHIYVTFDDVVYDRRLGIGASSYALGTTDADLADPQPSSCIEQDLLEPIYDRGQLVYTAPGLESIRGRAIQEIQSLPSSLQQLGSTPTPVGLDEHLFRLKTGLEAEERLRYSVREPEIRE